MNLKIKQFIKLFHSLEISWQIYSLLILYLIVMLITFIIHWKIGVMLLLLLIVFVLFFILNMRDFLKNLNVLANNLSRSVVIAQQEAVYRAPIGILLYDDNQRIRWINPKMQQLFGQSGLLGKRIADVDNDLYEMLEIEDDGHWHKHSFQNGYYKILHQKNAQAMYLFDISEEMKIRSQRRYDRLVFGYLYLDDYSEISETMDDEQTAKFESDLLTQINIWSNQYHLYIKRLDLERFIILCNVNSLFRLETNRFKIVQDLRERYHQRNIPLSISIGLAYPDENAYYVDELANQAQQNLDLALGRGGDQVVVRSAHERARFYGGTTKPTEKHSSIRSRLVYQALISQIDMVDKVLITGHIYPDTDSIGSAIGMYKIVKRRKKEAKILVNPVQFNRDIKQLLELGSAELDSVFVTHETLNDFIDDETLIIMVDHHKPSMSEAKDLIADYDVMIIDHHRRGEEYPESPVLSYIEVYASSTAELITEFFMNMRNTSINLTKFEATALLAGVIVDTNNFTQRTGSKTFDVASFLKSHGADTDSIQRILKEDLKHIQLRNKLVNSTAIFEDIYAISQASDNEIIDNVIAAQGADAILDIRNIEASFVIYRRSKNEVGISARSLGEINVQSIMERLDGGGHLSNAATQFKDISIQEANDRLLKSIKYDLEGSE